MKKLIAYINTYGLPPSRAAEAAAGQWASVLVWASMSDAEVVDRVESASTDQAKELRRVVAAIAAGQADGVVAAGIRCYSTDIDDFFDFLDDLKDAGGHLVAVREAYDTSGDVGLVTPELIEAFDTMTMEGEVQD